MKETRDPLVLGTEAYTVLAEYLHGKVERD